MHGTWPPRGHAPGPARRKNASDVLAFRVVASTLHRPVHAPRRPEAAGRVCPDAGRPGDPLIRDPFRPVHRLALATAVLMFGLIVLGSVVRTTGSGLSCPDWPLCEGRLIPRFQFNVLLEWTHRLVALVVGIGLLATAGWTLARAALRARLGGLAVLALALYLTQALLGALTVWKLLDPGVVGGHLATGL